MMGAHAVDDSNPYRSAELDYYTRVPLLLKDGTKEDVTRGELTRDSIGTAFLVTLYTDYTENGGV